MATRTSLVVLAAFAALLVCVSKVIAQQQAKPESKDSLYSGNNLKRETDPNPGGPAPVRDVSGSWAGNLASPRGEVPPLTPLGQELNSSIKTEREVGMANSNDPINTCDPMGLPRNLATETRGLAFGTMGTDRITVLHQYQRIWRYVWMDRKHELPKKFDADGGVPSRYYGYSVGHWDGDNTLVIDTTGLSDQTWLDRFGFPHSVDARVQERYERKDHNHLFATITVDDSKIFTKPFVLSTNEYRWIPDQEAEEQLCVPSDMINYMQIIADPSFHNDAQSR